MHEHRIIYDHDDMPLEHTDTWYAAERYVFDTVMTHGVPPEATP